MRSLDNKLSVIAQKEFMLWPNLYIFPLVFISGILESSEFRTRKSFGVRFLAIADFSLATVVMSLRYVVWVRLAFRNMAM